jgi:PhnB protein
MQITPYLSFNGTCEQAFEVYEKVLGGKIRMMMRYSDAPAAMPIPQEARDRIMHVSLEATGAVLMGGDAPPQMYSPMQGFSVSLSIDTPAEAERIFNALAEGANIRMPAMQETFWAQRFGMC